MIRHPLHLLPPLIVLGVAATLTGCAPPPAPEPTPLFASEEEAFAAAEETYRAYTDAFNRVDLANPDTFEDILEHTAGDVEKSDRKLLSEMSAMELTYEGATQILQFIGTGAAESGEQVTATSCVDVSEVNVVDEQGDSQVSPTRPDRYVLSLEFTAHEGRLRISEIVNVEGEACDL